jgi:hypothetical protein
MYRCPKCHAESATAGQSIDHALTCRPEDVHTATATAEQVTAGRDTMSELRAMLSRGKSDHDSM